MRYSRRRHVWLPLPLLLVMAVLALLPGKPSSSQPTPNRVQASVISSVPQPSQTSTRSRPAVRIVSVAALAPGASGATELAPGASPAQGSTSITSQSSPTESTVPTATPTQPSTANITAVAPILDGRVRGSAVNARSGPQNTASVTFVLSAGEAIRVGESEGGWTHVYRLNGEDGWVYHRYLAGPETVADAPSGSPRVALASPRLHSASTNFVRFQSPAPVLAAPTDEAPLLFVLEPDARVQVAETRGIWIRVVTTDGVSGWTQS
jgi:SH3-like domain-containing protein